MIDSQGNPIAIGKRAVIVKHGGPMSFLGKIGEIRAINLGCGALRGKPGIRVTDGPEGDPNWSCWIEPENVTVIS